MGLDTIDYIGKKHPKLLKFLSNFVIAAGYLMMAASLLLLIQVLIIMFKAPVLPKVPPLIPLVPYIDILINKALPTVNIPPFYFTYWIIVIGIVAVFHEFAHGVFAKLKNVRIISTGFGFIGPLLAAFVEIDEKQMEKKPVKAQLAVLAAGSTANLVLWIMFLAITGVFFTAAFVPSGVVFNNYMSEELSFSDIALIDNHSLSREIQNIDELIAVVENVNKSIVEIKSKEKSFFADLYNLHKQKGVIDRLDNDIDSVYLIADSPAFNANLSGAIQEISTESETYKIGDLDSLREALINLNAGQEVDIKTTKGNYSLRLTDHPSEEDRSALGISFLRPDQILELEKSNKELGTVGENFGKTISFFVYKKPYTYYEPKGNSTNGSIIVFIYNLLYWIMIVNFFVMLFNMLPVGIVDGGRFFYLTALGITKSKKKAFALFKLMTWFIILIFVGLMSIWFVKAF
ncbi:site-2 protease family protein [Nanoarchaeota archaeon]